MSEETIVVRVRTSDTTLIRVYADGREEVMPEPPPIPAMTDEDINAAARSDPDNPPREDYRPGRLTRLPRVRQIRRALHLTQEEFAERFQIPLGTLRDWEQGKSEPDQSARAYLRVIAVDPGAVTRALGASRVAEPIVA